MPAGAVQNTFAPYARTTDDEGLFIQQIPAGPGYGLVGLVIATTPTQSPQTADPTVSGGTLTRHEFARDASLLAGGAAQFQSVQKVTGGPLEEFTRRYDGAFLRGYLAGGSSYLIGAHSYYEEGVVRIELPHIFPYYFGHQATGNAAGRLAVVDDSGTPRFQWTQWEGTSPGSEVDYLFSSSVVPMSETATGSPPRFFHYAFLKDAGSISISIDGSLVETIGSVPDADPTAGSTRWGIGNTDQNITLCWIRAIGSDANAITSAVDSSPLVFTQDTFSPDGDAPLSYFDSGTAATYWNLFRVDGLNPSAPNLSEVFDSTLEARWVATDTLPAAGPRHADFSGGWTDLEADASLANMGDPQGRYLLVQLRFTPSSVTALQGAPAFLLGTGSTALWNTVPWGGAAVDPEPITVAGEPKSVGTLPIEGAFPWSVETRYVVAQPVMAGPYRVSWPLHTAGRRAFAFDVGPMVEADKDTLVAFLDTLRGGDAFDFPDPDGVTTNAVLSKDEASFERLGGGAYRVKFEAWEVIA